MESFVLLWTVFWRWFSVKKFSSLMEALDFLNLSHLQEGSEKEFVQIEIEGSITSDIDATIPKNPFG